MNKNIKYSQNFLTSEKVLNQIIKQLNLKETDTVYEIGTGKGHLTTKLAKISKQVTSIELDSHLFNLSSEKLKLNIRVTLIHQDILQFPFPVLLFLSQLHPQYLLLDLPSNHCL